VALGHVVDDDRGRPPTSAPAVVMAQRAWSTWPSATGSRRHRPRNPSTSFSDPSHFSSDDECDWESTIKRDAVLITPLDLVLLTPRREGAAAVT
jgi:hypothetical protein